MTSSRRCALACRPRPAMAALWPWTIRPARRGWRVRPPSPAGRRRLGRFTPPRPVRPPPPPPGAEWRPQRLGRDLARHQALQADIATVEGQLTRLLAATAGQILTTLPGVGAVRAASFAAHSLPIARFPTADHLYAATGLAPATWQSASLTRRGRISRQGLAEHRDALMGIAWGLSQYSSSFRETDQQLR